MKLQQVLGDLFDDAPIEIGLTFEQQVRLSDSVPDGLIRQSPLQIYFETKRGGCIWEDQIERHLNGIAAKFPEGTTCLLIGLTKEPSAPAVDKKLTESAAQRKIIYRGLTFSKLHSKLRHVCAPHEENLHRILDDYEAFLAQESLLDGRSKRMAAFLCGTSLAENIKYGLYYEPPSRPCRSGVSFVGAYAAKYIHALGRLQSIGIFSFKDNKISEVEPELGDIDAHQIERLNATVRDTEYYNLGIGDLRVYFVDKFVKTRIGKASAGPMRGFRYLNLSELKGAPARLGQTADELAAQLHGATFE
ncbi:hypothetical protein [Rhizobium sp. WSM1325]|uniref:hypothetical protein n=1 Tax=Rhizobium sp. WSM1325 TaxID=3444086 RepID=UPI000FF4B760|nr:hypothetical protein [Rhizobium leguminosarum]RWY66191.1 hypothetical protein EHI48_33025 [Rhizobium leguminosarum]